MSMEEERMKREFKALDDSEPELPPTAQEKLAQTLARFGRRPRQLQRAASHSVTLEPKTWKTLESLPEEPGTPYLTLDFCGYVHRCDTTYTKEVLRLAGWACGWRWLPRPKPVAAEQEDQEATHAKIPLTD